VQTRRRRIDIDWYEADMQRTLDKHGQDCIKLRNKAAGSRNHADPDEIVTIRAITLSTMMYIANRLSETGGRKITEPQLQTICIQAEEQSVISSPQLTVKETKQKPAHPTIAWYEDQLQEVMETYHESVLHLLKQGQTMYLLSSYEKLRSEHFPIMTGIATLIQHLGENEISIKSLTNRTHQAEEEALRQYSNAKQTKILPEQLDRSKDKELPETSSLLLTNLRLH
jgi:hypothetical protein